MKYQQQCLNQQQIYSISNIAIPTLHLHQILKVDTRPQTLRKGNCTRVTNGAVPKTETK